MAPKKPKTEKQKQQLDQQAWAWAEHVDDAGVTREHVETAYRINLPSCKPHFCRRNCKGNPRCVNALGEGKWYQQIKDSAWHEIPDPENEKRGPGTFAGLKNLGATCYVNTFLQVWFHNSEIRKAVFDWPEPVSDEQLLMLTRPLVEMRDELRMDELEKLLEPSTVCSHLQAVFAQLQFSKRRHVDPTPFINSLGLDAALQQDAQEFSKLFMCLLEDTMSHSSSGRNFIEHQFQGHYQYITRCNGCQGESKRPSQFYELDLNIKGHKTLDDCIGEFLQEEKLEGDNQYACSYCNSKQNATRSINLQSLPPVFNLQLLRFVFDRKTGHKKKLNTFIEFAEVLDMSEYVGKEEGEVVYDLRAVLIHRGPSAYSGHYIAHIKERHGRHWFKFNDEEIEKMGGKKLELGTEEELEAKVGPKKPKTGKGFHASRNAYMLVYALRTGEGSDDESSASSSSGHNELNHFHKEHKLQDLPLKMQRFIEHDDNKFELWISQMNELREMNVADGNRRQEDVKSLFTRLPWNDGEEFEWVTTEWLSTLLTTDYANKINSLDNKELLCAHNKVDPDKVLKAKCISKHVAEEAIALYKGGPRLDRTSLCEACVRSRARGIRTRARIAEDHKVISAFIKTKHTPTNLAEHYWVGKQSLRSWKRFAMGDLEAVEAFEAQNGLDDSVSSEANKSIQPIGSLGEKGTPSMKDEELVNQTQRLDENGTPGVIGRELANQHRELDEKGTPGAIGGVFANKQLDLDEKGTSGVIDGELTNQQAPESTCDLVTSSNSADLHESTEKHTQSASEKKGDVPPISKEKEITRSTSCDSYITGSKTNALPSKSTMQEELSFNDDVQCEPHDQLVIDEPIRRLVPAHIWQRLRHYFPTAPEYRGDTAPCLKCTADVEEELRVKTLNKDMASEQKTALSNLYFDRNRPTWSKENTQLCVVGAGFLDKWRRFIKDPQKHPAPDDVNNISLLCFHQRFMYDPATLMHDARTHHLRFVTLTEWSILKSYMAIDFEICISRVQEDSGYVTFIVSPDPCTECQGAREAEEWHQQSNYKNAVIYIRKRDVIAPASNQVTAVKADTVCNGGNDDDNSWEPDFVNEHGKRKLVGTTGQEKVMKIDVPSGTFRRSSRHRRSPGEKQINVSSTDTLRDLKIKIMELFSVAPFDQTLSLDGRVLGGDKTTLSSLRVQPGDTLLLKEDEPSEDPIYLDDPKASAPEEGFKGTGLLGR